MVYIKQQTEVNEETIRTLLFPIFKDFPHLASERYIERTVRALAHTQRYNDMMNKLILNALDEITVEQPDWTFVAARLYLQQLYDEAAKIAAMMYPTHIATFMNCKQCLSISAFTTRFYWNDIRKKSSKKRAHGLM